MKKHFPTTFAIAVAALTLFQVSNAEEKSSQECRLKYSGEMYIEGDYSQAIGVSTKSKAFTRSSEHTSMKAEMFMFYECKIDGYYSYPDEYGFLVAQSSSTEFCATAYQDGYDQQNGVSYSICHRHCDYAASNMEVVNRQLVKATYVFDESFGGRVQMTFQGSPNSQTNTGFDQQYAHVQPSKHRHSKVHPKTQVVKINNDSHGSKMALRNVTVHAHTCINPGKRTSNEEMIMQHFKMDGDMHFGYDAMQYFSSYGSIF